MTSDTELIRNEHSCGQIALSDGVNQDISNKELLPVTSIAYGPMELEAQSAKIEIGMLNCYPQENSYNVKSYINSLETRLNMTDEILEKHDNQIGEIQEMVTLSDQTLDRHETSINDLSTDRCLSNPCITRLGHPATRNPRISLQLVLSQSSHNSCGASWEPKSSHNSSTGLRNPRITRLGHPGNRSPDVPLQSSLDLVAQLISGIL